jgi:hypothetical protein
MITYVAILASNSSDVVGWEARLEQLMYLIYSDLTLVLFVDEFYRSKMTFPIPANVTVLVWIPEQTKTFQEAANYPELSRGHERNDNKDTRYYCTLMNSKMEMVLKAIDEGYVKTSHVGYIDACVSKLFKEKQGSFQRLKNLRLEDLNSTKDRILAPGSWHPCILTVKIGDMLDRVCWVFSGSLLIGSVEKMRWFHEQAQAVFREMLEMRYILWETNVWAVVLAANKDEFNWYPGHHSDELSMIPTSFWRPEGAV